MNFLWPSMLFSLILVPVLVYVYVRMVRARRKAMAAGLAWRGLSDGKQRTPGFRRHVPPLLFLSGLSLLLVASARPQARVTLPRVEGTVILGIDVSGSMAAEDMPPNRMAAAKEAIKSFVERMPETVQIGVVAFSDNGFSVQIPTGNREDVLAAVDRLRPQRGTSLGQGIMASLNVLAQQGNDTTPQLLSNRTPEPTAMPTDAPPGVYAPGVIVLLTDGENTSAPDPFTAVQEAARRGVRIYTVGVGSPEGIVLKVEGFSVRTRLDESMLQQVSETTGGAYFRAGSADELRDVYNNLTPQLVVRAESMEVTSLFAGASIFILILGGVFSLLWFSRLP